MTAATMPTMTDRERGRFTIQGARGLVAWLLRLACSGAVLTLAAAQERPAPAHGSDPPPVSAGVATREFVVPLHAGELDLAEFASALLREYGLEAEAVPLPSLRVDLRGVPGALLLAGARRLLLQTVELSRDLEAQRLRVVIDRERARTVRRDLRSRVRRLVALFGGDAELQPCRLTMPPQNDPQRPLCVLVHGVESGPEMFAELRAFLARQEPAPQVATFSHPDDGSIEHAARELSLALRGLAGQRVDLVGHSMGGLIARAVVETRELDPGTVRTLVMVGTPNAGSGLAGLRFALEVADLLRGNDRDDGAALGEVVAAVADRLRDGIGEAGGDLTPDSVFFHRLAACERNHAVDYHLVLGTRSLLRPAQLAVLRRELAARLDEAALGRLVRPRVERWIADLDELVEGRGDGAVSVARGRLDGVEPVLVPLDHVGLLREHGLFGRRVAAGEHPVFVRIAQWLRE